MKTEAADTETAREIARQRVIPSIFGQITMEGGIGDDRGRNAGQTIAYGTYDLERGWVVEGSEGRSLLELLKDAVVEQNGAHQVWSAMDDAMRDRIYAKIRFARLLLEPCDYLPRGFLMVCHGGWALALIAAVVSQYGLAMRIADSLERAASDNAPALRG